MVRWIALRSAWSSQRNESQKPWTAWLAAQYAACNGMPRYASADPTWTMTPRLRGRMCAKAARVPCTVSR